MGYAIICDHGIRGIVHCEPCRKARANENVWRRTKYLGLTQEGKPYQFHPYGTPAAQKVLDRIERVDGCWVFQGSTGRGGYARIRDGKRMRYAHAVVYEALVGPVPEGTELDHVYARGCRTNACVNPAHLEPVTARENMLRMAAAKPPEYHSARMRKAWVTRKARKETTA